MMQNNVDQYAASGLESSQEATPMMILATVPAPPAYIRRPRSRQTRPGKGVQEDVKKPTRFRVGKVTVTELKNPATGRLYFLLRYTDRETGKDVKRRVECSRKKAREMADNLTSLVYQGKGYLARPVHAPSIEDALLDAIKLANTQSPTSKLRTFYAEKFVQWLAAEYPGVATWDQLRPAMVQRYVNELEQSGRAFDTVRLSVAPVKLAWRHMAENYPEFVSAPPRIRLQAPPKRDIECLAPAEVAALLDWLKAHCPALWPMGCLMGLAGLRMLEAAALRFQDVDLKAGLVTIAKTDHHTPKTRDSYRTIPVCGEVKVALQAASDSQKVVPPGGELFVNEDGEPWKKDALTHRWCDVLKRAAATPEVDKPRSNGRKLTRNKHGLALHHLAMVPARKLRAAFATMAGRLGAPRELLKAYIGHSSGDVLGVHYRRIDRDELATVSGVIEGWRNGALDFTSRNKSGNQVLEASGK